MLSTSKDAIVLRLFTESASFREQFDRRAAGPMFAATCLFLLLLSGVLHLHEEVAYRRVMIACCWGLAVLWPLYGLECAVHAALGSPRWKQNLLYCLVPPLRLGARDHATATQIWLPAIGWSVIDETLRTRVAKALSLPMIGIALLVLPLMGAEFAWADKLQESPRLAMAAQTATGLIWLAFTAEFLVMISIVERKLRYCKEHWIDLAVILLPLVAFLRAARLGRLLRMQQLPRTVRVYRLRGLMLKAYKSLLLLDAIDRLIRGGPEARLLRLQAQCAEKEQELERMRNEIRALEATVSQPPHRKAA